MSNKDREKLWNVFQVRPTRKWLGTVSAPNEATARLVALSRFDIPADVDFEVSER